LRYSAHQIQYNLDQSGQVGFEPTVSGAVAAFLGCCSFLPPIYLNGKAVERELNRSTPTQSIFAYEVTTALFRAHF
jgi:hypothetical protein